MPLRKHTTLIILSLLTLISSFLHIYNLNWGAPFYFHPDERNIASAVSQLQYPFQMNPHFFAYGSLPIYTIYFTGVLLNFITHFSSLNTPFPFFTVPFELAIVISRFYSALFATLLVPILFLIGKKIKNETVGLIAAFLAASSVGLIQFAHFGTFELWLTFFTVLLFLACLELKKHATDRSLVILALLSGILAAIKISHLAVIPLALLVITIQEWIQNKPRHHVYKIARIVRGYILFFTLLISIYTLTNPFVLLDPKGFQGSMHYESGVALGTIPVFYTGEFRHTIPIVFQFFNVYPFLINPLLTIVFLAAFLYLVYRTIITKNFFYFLTLSFFLVLLLSQAFLYVKWVRYMVPTLPFIYLIISLALYDVLQKRKLLYPLAITILLFVNTIFGVSYFITAFVRPDTRMAANAVVQQYIPKDARILSEVYDLGIVPFNETFPNIVLFNFYELDTGNASLAEAIMQAKQAEYIVIPSQRVFKARFLHRNDFPQGNKFYQQLFNGSLGYYKIYETPCDVFCQITYLGDPVNNFEQTANVFDRPTLFIFKKQ